MTGDRTWLALAVVGDPDELFLQAGGGVQLAEVRVRLAVTATHGVIQQRADHGALARRTQPVRTWHAAAVVGAVLFGTRIWKPGEKGKRISKLRRNEPARKQINKERHQDQGDKHETSEERNTPGSRRQARNK